MNRKASVRNVHARVKSYTETAHVILGETSGPVQAKPLLHNEDILGDGLCLLLGCQGVLHIRGIKERDYLLWLWKKALIRSP